MQKNVCLIALILALAGCSQQVIQNNEIVTLSPQQQADENSGVAPLKVGPYYYVAAGLKMSDFNQ